MLNSAIKAGGFSPAGVPAVPGLFSPGPRLGGTDLLSSPPPT